MLNCMVSAVFLILSRSELCPVVRHKSVFLSLKLAAEKTLVNAIAITVGLLDQEVAKTRQH